MIYKGIRGYRRKLEGIRGSPWIYYDILGNRRIY